MAIQLAQQAKFWGKPEAASCGGAAASDADLESGLV